MPAAARVTVESVQTPAGTTAPHDLKLGRVSTEYGEVEGLPLPSKSSGPLSPRAQAIR